MCSCGFLGQSSDSFLKLTPSLVNLFAFLPVPHTQKRSTGSSPQTTSEKIQTESERWPFHFLRRLLTFYQYATFNFILTLLNILFKVCHLAIKVEIMKYSQSHKIENLLKSFQNTLTLAYSIEIC